MPMPRRRTRIATLVAAVAASIGVAATPRVAAHVVTLRFPADVPPGVCHVRASVQTSPRRTGGTFSGAPSADGTYAFAPTPDFDGSVGLRAIVDCPGRGLGLVDLPANAKSWTVDLALPQLGTVTVRGTVQTDAVLPLAGLHVGVRSNARTGEWQECEWLLNPVGNAIDCITFLGGQLLGTAPLDADGHFEATLPDVGSDLALKGVRVWFRFALDDQAGHEVAALVPDNGSASPPDIGRASDVLDRIANGLSDAPLVFRAVRCTRMTHDRAPSCEH